MFDFSMPMHSTTFCGNKRAYSSGQTQQHDCETKRIHKSIAWVPRQLECRMFRTFLPSNWYQQKTQAHQEGLTTQHGFLPWPKQRHCARTNGAIEQKKLRTPLPPPKKPDFLLHCSTTPRLPCETARSGNQVLKPLRVAKDL